MMQLFQQLEQTLKEHKNAVLVTVAASSGSTPRGAGAHMLVTGQGRIAGTIGGGAVENRAIQDAMELFRSGGAERQKLYDMSPGAGDLGMVCGGKILVELKVIRE